jgi:hypothetical protein
MMRLSYIAKGKSGDIPNRRWRSMFGLRRRSPSGGQNRLVGESGRIAADGRTFEQIQTLSPET